jgi:prefoldin subunit 5
MLKQSDVTPIEDMQIEELPREVERLQNDIVDLTRQHAAILTIAAELQASTDRKRRQLDQLRGDGHRRPRLE